MKPNRESRARDKSVPAPSDNPADMSDIVWLVGDDGAAELAQLADVQATPAVAAQLRRRYSAERVRLLLDQTELRKRARVKFRDADRMFFTRTLLEQATDEACAAYKADRFPISADRREAIADICCGIGGDLISLARRSAEGRTRDLTLAPSETTTPPSIDLDALDVTALARSSPLPICVLGIDRDPIAAVLAEANSLACGVSAATRIIESDASSAELGGVRWLHIDPDRRADGRRSTRADRFSPDVDVIERLVRDALRHDGGAAVKLAPVTAAPDRWIAQGECEWIGSRGECRQQVVWLGELARSAGTRSATVVDARTGRPATIRTSPSDAARQCTAANVQVRELGASPAQFLYEPHAAVLAARLEAELADRHGLESVAANIAYFGGDRLIDDPLLAAFAIEDVLPLDERQLRGALRLRKIGRLEIKKRGVDISPEQLRARLRLDGDGDATLLLFRDSRGGRAVLARRVHTSTSQTDS